MSDPEIVKQLRNEYRQEQRTKAERKKQKQKAIPRYVAYVLLSLTTLLIFHQDTLMEGISRLQEIVPFGNF